MKEEKVARPDVLSYEQGRQDEQKRVVMRPIDLKELPKEIEYLIKQAKVEERKRVLDEIEVGVVSVAGLIEKARQEVAREIFEELDWEETAYESIDDESPLMEVLMSRKELQSLKSRFLKEEKQKGFTDEELADLRHNACDDTIG